MGLLKLLGLCVSMFLGAFVCGEIPLRCTMNQRTMKYVTTVGVGLLIGVSFIVIIPEGVHTYYGAVQTKPIAAMPLALNSTAGGALLGHDHTGESKQHEHASGSSGAHDHAHEHESEAGHVEGAAHSHSHEEGEAGSAGGHAHADCVDLSRSSSSVGAALVLGFVVMFLVDRLGGSEGHDHGHGGGGDSHAQGADGHAHHHRPLTAHAHIHSSEETAHSDGSTVSASAAANNQHTREGSADSADTDAEHADPHAEEQNQLLTRSLPLATALDHGHELPPLRQSLSMGCTEGCCCCCSAVTTFARFTG